VIIVPPTGDSMALQNQSMDFFRRFTGKK
jgi:hypothetical protein